MSQRLSFDVTHVIRVPAFFFGLKDCSLSLSTSASSKQEPSMKDVNGIVSCLECWYSMAYLRVGTLLHLFASKCLCRSMAPENSTRRLCQRKDPHDEVEDEDCSFLNFLQLSSQHQAPKFDLGIWSFLLTHF